MRTTALTILAAGGTLLAFGSIMGAAGQEWGGELAGQSVTVDGGTLAFRIGGDGPPLLLVHGFSLTSHVWDPLLQPLLAEYTVILPDLPGHGQSSWLSHGSTRRETARALNAALDSLGFHGVRAVGHSAGAVTVLHMALDRPGRIEAMALIDGAHRLSEASRGSLASVTIASAGPAQLEHYRRYHPGGEAQVGAIYRELRAMATDFGDEVTVETLAAVSTRALLIWGDRDPINPLHLALEMHDALPNASIWVVPGQGHSPIFEELGGSAGAAGRFSGILREFFSAQGPSSGPDSA